MALLTSPFEKGKVLKISFPELLSFRPTESEIDGKRVELLTKKYFIDLDWAYLEKRARSPENDTLKELLEFKKSAGR